MRKAAYWNAGVVLLVWAGLSMGATIYVVPGDSIQVAINAATDGDRIEVAPGTYWERISLNGKAIRLYSRSGAVVTTIDAMGTGSVVQCISGEGASTTLEGFTITRGRAPNGGGMYNVNSSPTVTGCVFVGNVADSRGGGMYNKNSHPAVSDCAFSENVAVGDDGGGMANENSSPAVRNCTFRLNTAKDGGGGMHNRSLSQPRVTCCTFERNVAEDGGGIQNFSDSSPTIQNCTFLENSAVNGNGGGIDNTYDSHATIMNCTFSKNLAEYGGAILSGWGSNPVIAGCLFVGNSAAWGGGLYHVNAPAVTVTNCTFGANVTPRDGGAVYNDNSSGLTVANSIMWGNTPNSIKGAATVTYSDVEGGWRGEGNLKANPGFIGGGDYHLQAGSPCFDAGDNAAVVILTDLDGAPRIQGAAVDMGAFERSTIPDPILVFTGTEDYTANGQRWTRYCLSVTNWLEYPAEMFAPAPDLPPCGLNSNASRTWVEIYTAQGMRLYGFCALTQPDDLDGIWFALAQGSTPPSAVYITLKDRRSGTTHMSNLVGLARPTISVSSGS
jgi:hypothetical protein